MSSVLQIIAGIVLIAVLLQDAFETMIVPRRVPLELRLTRFYFQGLWPVLPAGAAAVHRRFQPA